MFIFVCGVVVVCVVLLVCGCFIVLLCVCAFWLRSVSDPIIAIAVCVGVVVVCFAAEVRS